MEEDKFNTNGSNRQQVSTGAWLFDTSVALAATAILAITASLWTMANKTSNLELRVTDMRETIRELSLITDNLEKDIAEKITRKEIDIALQGIEKDIISGTESLRVVEKNLIERINSLDSRITRLEERISRETH